MTIRKEQLHRLIDRLDQKDEKVAQDFLEFLVQRSEKTSEGWREIDNIEPDNESLSKEELEQLNSEEGYISGKVGKREFGIQVDLP